MFADITEEMEKMSLDISVEEALQNPEQPEAKKLLTKLSQANKQAMIKDDIETIKEMKGEDGSGRNILTEYCVEEYNDIVFVGRKEEPRGPHREYQAEWFFRGFCTYQEFKEGFAEAYDKFQEEYGDYNFYDEDGCDVYLEVSGAILGDNILINYPTKDYWKDKRVLVTSFGIASPEGMTTEQTVFGQYKEQFDKDVEQIKEQGGPTTYEEAKKLRISEDIERIWMGEYRQFYED